MVKDTSLVGVIGIFELYRTGQKLVSDTFLPFEVWTGIALLYIAIVFAIDAFVRLTERHLRPRPAAGASSPARAAAIDDLGRVPPASSTTLPDPMTGRPSDPRPTQPDHPTTTNQQGEHSEEHEQAAHGVGCPRRARWPRPDGPAARRPPSAQSPAAHPASADQSSGSVLNEIINRGELRVGMNLQYPPETYLDDNDKPAGYDVELLNLLAEDLGVELTIENQEFDALIPGLLAGQWDMISVGLVPPPARLLQMSFSDSYVPYEQVLVVAADSDHDPTISAYNTAGTTITTLQGARPRNRSPRQFPEATLAEFPQQDAAFLEVVSGRADAIVVESYLAEQFIQANPGTLEIVPLRQPAADPIRRLRHPLGRRPVHELPQPVAAVLQEQRDPRLDLRRGLRVGSQRQHLGAGDRSRTSAADLLSLVKGKNGSSTRSRRP